MKMIFVSTANEKGKEIYRESDVDFVPDGGEENQLINIYPQMKYQVFEGFGGALTESAGYVFNQMTEAQKE